MSSLRIARFSTATLWLAASGCGAAVNRTTNLDRLMESIRQENVATAARRDSVARARQGTVEVVSTPTGPVLSVILNESPLAPVVQRILDESRLPYVVEDHGPAGRASVRFHQKPLVDGLNLLLGREGFRAAMRDGVLVIRPVATAMPDSGDTPDDVIQREVRLDHLDEKSTAAIVLEFLTGGNLRSQFDPARGRVLVWGPRKDVDDATAMLHRADRPVSHVLLEALVVEFSEGTLRDMGVSWSQGQTGRFSAIEFMPGSESADQTLSFMRSNTTTPLQFVTLVQALAGTDKARIVARPFLSARSGEPATVDIGDTRYYFTQTVVGGIVTTTAQQVMEGVTMTITPTALNDERVRVDLNIQESQFIPTVENAAATVARNAVSTSMQVPSGQTIVIGGLALDRQSRSHKGVPLLRYVPLVNLFTSRASTTRSKTEVVIFITPRIWTPDVDLPFVRPGFMEIDPRLTPKKPTP